MKKLFVTCMVAFSLTVVSSLALAMGGGGMGGGGAMGGGAGAGMGGGPMGSGPGTMSGGDSTSMGTAGHHTMAGTMSDLLLSAPTSPKF